MKGLILIGFSLVSAGAVANQDSVTVEGGFGRFHIKQAESFATTPGILTSTNGDISAGYLEVGTSMRLNSFLDVYGTFGGSGRQNINKSMVLLEDSEKQYLTSYFTEIEGKQLYLSTGLDIHTSQQDTGLSAGARIGYSMFQQSFSVQQALTSSTDPALKDQENILQTLNESQLKFVPVYGVYLQYQFNKNDSVRLAVNTVTIDLDTKELSLKNPLNVNIEQEILMGGLLFTHRY